MVTKTLTTIKRKSKLRDLHGILSGKRGEEFEKAILESREQSRKMHEKRHKKHFGTHKFKKPTKEILDESDKEGWDD